MGMNINEHLSDGEKEGLLRTAWYLANDCYRTDVILCYTPYQIALACIRLALESCQIDASLCQLQNHMEASRKYVDQISAALVSLYRSCSDMKEKELISLCDKLDVIS